MLLSNSSTYFSFYQNFRNRDISLIKFFEILSYRSQQSRNHYRVLPSKTISSINLVWNCGFKTYSPSKNIRMSQKNRTNGDRKLLRTIKKQKSKISLNDWKSFKKENEKLKRKIENLEKIDDSSKFKKKKKMEKHCSEFQRKRIESYFKYQKMKPRIRFQISKGREIASNPNRKEWKIIPNLKCENWKTRFRLCRMHGAMEGADGPRFV